MCNHRYTAGHFEKQRAMGERCPYPELYEKVGAMATSTPEMEPTLALLIDDGGTCIFHSHQVEWKRENDFKGKFLQLLQLLDTDKTSRVYNFAEFVFVGSEVATKKESPEYLLHFADTVFGKQAYFTGASFLDAFVLEGCDFRGAANFEYVNFAGDLR